MNLSQQMNLLEIETQTETDQLVKISPFDGAHLISNFNSRPLNVIELATVPRRLTTVYKNGGPGGIYTTRITLTTIRNIYPDLFKTYSTARFDIKYVVVITPTYNHTGLVALSYIPFNQIFVSTPNVSSYSWYATPDKRVFGRINKDHLITLEVPWNSSVAAIRSQANSTSFLSGESFSHRIRLDAMTSVNSGADSYQDVKYEIFMQLTNIKVGGYLGGIF